MAQTLASSTTPLCPVSEFLKRVDKAAVALLASDTVGVPVPSGQLPTDPNVLAALTDGSGLFESAVMMGGNYTAADLQTLLTTTCSAQGMMFRIISDLAWAYLFDRRPNMNVPTPPSMNRSLEWMELLSQGKRIFAFVEAQEATVMSVITATDDDEEERNGLVQKGRDYFGVTT